MKQFLLLLIRMLIIGALVLAFAQPVIRPDMNSVKTSVVNIYVDNSLSMEGLSGNGSLIELAKTQAASIAIAYDNTTQFQLLTNDFEGGSQTLLDKSTFLDRLSKVQPTPQFRLLSDVYERQVDEMGTAEHKEFYWISDFQRTSADFTRILPDTNRQFTFVSVQPLSYNNLFVDSIWFETPVRQAEKEERLMVRIVNDGEDNVNNLTVRFLLNDAQRASIPVSVDAHDAVVANLPFTQYDSGNQFGVVSISDFPITFDNRYYIAYQIYDKIKVRSICGGDTNRFITALFLDDTHIDYKNMLMASMDYSEIDRSHCIIISMDDKLSSGMESKIGQFTAEGGSALIVPGRDLQPEDLNDFLLPFHSVTITGFDTTRVRLGKINYDHILFRDVFKKRPDRLDKPEFNGYFKVNINPRSKSERLLDYVDGAPCYLRFPNHNGWIYLMTTPLDALAGNWPRHALFVPTVYNTALMSISPEPMYYVLGSNQPVELPLAEKSDDQMFRMRNIASGSSFIPRINQNGNKIHLFADDQIETSGFYTLCDARDSILRPLAYNHDHKESDVRTYSPDDLSDIVKQRFGRKSLVFNGNDLGHIDRSIKERTDGIVLWPLFILISLVLLGLETAVIRWWKSNRKRT